MILLLAVVAGLIAGLTRAWIGKRIFQTPKLKLVWLVLLAVVPQLLSFNISGTSSFIPDNLASVILVSSQVLLSVFVLANLDMPGFWALGLGLGMNLLVIVLNGGWMPISPETVLRLAPEASPDTWQIGARLGMSKDIVLSVTEMRLWWFSDRYLIPMWLPWRVAYSLGDVLIAAGVFWFLWVQGGCHQREEIAIQYSTYKQIISNKQKL